MATSSYFIFALFIIGLNVVVFTPLMIYFGYVFFKRSKHRIKEDNEVFFNRRHSSTIYATIAFSIFFVTIERPLSFLIYQMNVINLPYQYGSMDDPFQFFAYGLGAYGIYFTFLIRFWMIFYSYKYAVAHAKLVWKKQLNPDYNQNDNFFFAEADCYGSFESISPCILCMWMLTVFLLPLITTISGIPFDIATVFLLLPPFIVLSYIAYRISPITDQYFIRDELVFCIVIMGISLSLHLLIYLCIGLTTKDIKLQILLGSLISSMQYTLLCYVITIWVLQKNDMHHVVRPKSMRSKDGDAHIRAFSNSTYTYTSFLGFNPSFRSGRTLHEKEEKGIRERKLYNLLKEKHGFNLFMMHLTRELSVENLLFICELIQFKQALCDQHLKGKISGWMEQLPNEFIPRCEAVTKYRGDYLSQMHLIYEKYICPGSALEVNISSRRRKCIMVQFDDVKQNRKVDANLMAMGWKQLSMFFDAAGIEVMKLMSDSFGRIQSTDEYEMWHSRLPKIKESRRQETYLKKKLKVPTESRDSE